jgi:hypothetical protein
VLSIARELDADGVEIPMPQQFVANCKLKGHARVNLRAAVVAGTLWLIAPIFAFAAEIMPGIDSMVVDPGAPPTTEMGGGSYFFAQDLGTMLRVRYNTESYGQDNESGNLDIGTMQMISFDDSAVFFDGQVTLNDPDGVGFNVGVGYRWMSFQSFASSPGVMQGVSIWADGTNTEADNFFPQIGLSYESLGEMWDLRANGYIPVGDDTQIGDFEGTGGIGFQGNSIAQLTQATVDTSFYVGEAELARRLTRERDAWAFAGPYFLANDSDDTLGYRAGLRGYAYPDLLLQIAVSNDDIFDTNAAFTMIWFVGRTRTHFRPACGVPDRFREPVMRNDYVALAQSTIAGGVPLTGGGGEDLRFVHVNSNAAPGGDGTFENPFDMVTDVNGAGSVDGDIILVHSNSVFSGENVVLKDDQRFLGEGLDADDEPLVHTVVTFEEGIIDIPESSPGARELPRPMINDAVGAAISLADANEVANFDIDGGTNAIAGTGLTGNANLHDLGVTDTAEFAISLTDTATTSTVTLDDFIYDGGATGGGIDLANFDGTFNATNSELANGTQEGLFVHNNGMGDVSDGAITFANTVMFESVDGTTVHVDGFTGVLAVNGDITNDMGLSTEIENISLAGTSVTFGAPTGVASVIIDTGDGIRIHDNTGGTIRFNSNVDLTTDASSAIVATDNTGAEIDFGGLVEIATTTGTGFEATGGGTLTADNPNNTITTTTGQIANISDMTLSTTGVFFGDINRTMAGASTNAVLLEDNTGGPITLGTLFDDAGESGTIQGGTVDAIAIRNSADVSISGLIVNNTSPVAGLRIVKNTTGTMTLDLNDLAINNGDTGIDVAGGAGTLNMSVNDTAINGPTNIGMNFDNVDTGTIAVINSTVDGNGATATAGVRITNSNANFNFDNNTTIQEVNGVDFDVNGGTPNITFAGDLINTVGLSAQVQNITGGTVNFTSVSSIDDDGNGLRVLGNTGGTISFLGTNDFDTIDGVDAVVLTNNGGATLSFAGLNIDTTNGTDNATGRGFVATGGGTLTMSGTTNVIATDNGTGLLLENMTIGAVDLQSVTVQGTTGPVNAIVLRDLTGGQVAIGPSTGLVGAGGTLESTDDAIVLENVQNVDLRRIRITGAGDAAGDHGIEINHTNGGTTAMDVTIDSLTVDMAFDAAVDVTGDNSNALNFKLTNGTLMNNVAIDIIGAGAFGLLVDNTDITTTALNDDAFALTFSGAATSGDVTIRNTSTFMAVDANALFIDSFGGTGKTIDMNIQDSTFSNNTATSATADIRARDTTLMNATIQGNTFTNSAGGGVNFDMSSSGASAFVRLNLGGAGVDQNNATGGVEEFRLHELLGSDFDVFEAADTFAGLRNADPVIPDPNAAAFDNLAAPPPLPTVPP